ncbi:hypothetical protein [Pseudoalteromonas piscicida]|uniref:hypothetical protein n=1 Tax=Pseudoalteromonas piscicida TaxID=43662 RepID=UPI0027E41A41|nr:hypothetical protein [Pseudoalteromonas piscicida]WMO16381.1 hypothetical protein NI376_19225 [Pseudoalteromonas piscicida]
MDTEHNSAAIFTRSKLQTHIKAALLCSAAIQLPVAVASSALANAEALQGGAAHTAVSQQALEYVQSRLTGKAITVTRDPNWGRLEFLQCTPLPAYPFFSVQVMRLKVSVLQCQCFANGILEHRPIMFQSLSATHRLTLQKMARAQCWMLMQSMVMAVATT